MLVHLYGADSYRRSRRLRELIAARTKKDPPPMVERFELDGDGALARLSAFLENQSLFGGEKLGVIYASEGAADEVVDAIKARKDDPATTLVVVSEKKLGAGWSFLYRRPAEAEAFEPLKGRELSEAIAAEASSRGAKLPEAARRDLAETYGSDLWAITRELDTVALGGTPAERTAAPQFFTLIQTLKHPDLGRRLSALAYLLEGEESAAVFNVLAAVSPPAAKVRMADYDIAVKSGKLEYPEALTDLAVRQ